jgi:hypothetical protein
MATCNGICRNLPGKQRVDRTNRPSQPVCLQSGCYVLCTDNGDNDDNDDQSNGKVSMFELQGLRPHPNATTLGSQRFQASGFSRFWSLPAPPKIHLQNPISPRMHKYHLLAGISTILAISSIALVFFYSPSKTVLYVLLICPTSSLLHHIFIFLVVPSPLRRPSSQRVSHQGSQRCALSGPLNEIEKSILNLLSLALLTVLAMATGGAAWLFIALNLLTPTTPTPNAPTASWSYLYSSSISELSSLPPEREQTLPAAVWVLEGGALLAQATVLASMFAIAARESRIANIASRGDCAYQFAHIGLDAEQLMCVDESRPEVDTVRR